MPIPCLGIGGAMISSGHEALGWPAKVKGGFAMVDLSSPPFFVLDIVRASSAAPNSPVMMSHGHRR
jgi:hypothetical protein